MRELPIIDDKRLLGALDYIDERFIAEVTEEYEIFDPAPGAKLPPRARMYRFRQFAALAACLILLSFASLGVNYVANAVISFVASAGESNTETNVDEQDSEHIDSPYERAIDAYPEGMSAEEIYADVLKGGWVVQDGDVYIIFDAGKDIWQNFLYSVDNKLPISILFANFSDDIVRLSEIHFNGDTFVIKQQFRSNGAIIENECKEFRYLIKSEKLGKKYFFANHPDADPLMISGDEISLYDKEANFVVVWVD